MRKGKSKMDSRVFKHELNQIALFTANEAGYQFDWDAGSKSFWDVFVTENQIWTSELDSFKQRIIRWLDQYAISYKHGEPITKEAYTAMVREYTANEVGIVIPECCLNTPTIELEDSFTSDFAERLESSDADVINEVYRHHPNFFRKEKEVQAYLKQKLGGKTEFSVDFGRIDLLTTTAIWEIKHISCWKHALGQVLAYGYSIPGKELKLALFGVSYDDMPLLSRIHDVCEIADVAVFGVASINHSYSLFEVPLSRKLRRSDTTKPATVSTRKKSLKRTHSNSLEPKFNDFRPVAGLVLPGSLDP